MSRETLGLGGGPRQKKRELRVPCQPAAGDNFLAPCDKVQSVAFLLI